MGNKAEKRYNNNKVIKKPKTDVSNKLNIINKIQIKEKTKEETLDIIKNIHPNRKTELLNFLLSKVEQDSNLRKFNIQKASNKTPFLPFISRFDSFNKEGINSNCILISNDIIIIQTKDIYNEKERKAISISFPNVKEDIIFSKNNFIVENKSQFTLMKVLEPSFLFEKYFEIPDDTLDIDSSEKYFINEKKEEESLGINITNQEDINIDINYYPGSPIYIKKENKIFLVGIIINKTELCIFNRNDLLDIRTKIESIEFKLKLYQIKKLDFSKEIINDEEMYFIFDYDYINLEYLNLENKNLTDKGIRALLNNSLENIKFLNISNNPITDEGLIYLKYLSNLNELLLLNMDKLSDDYFAFLQVNSFIDEIKSFKCDKKRLTLNYVNINYNNFSLPNLTSLKMISPKMEIQKNLKELILLDNIISRIIELDLSNTDLIDNGMLRLSKNIQFFKKIETINLEYTVNININSIINKLQDIIIIYNINKDIYCAKITTESIKHIDKIEKQNIKIILDKANIRPRLQKKKYNVLLGGSTVSGKTSYFNAYMSKTFNPCVLTTIGVENSRTQYKNINFCIYDTCRWNGRYDNIVKNYIFIADAVILLFDISDKNDFDELPKCLRMITDYFELEDFPVLLIGNKIDIKKAVKDEEIKEFLKKEEFIGYYEVSSKTFLNVDNSLNFMLNYIYEKEKKFPMMEIFKK